MGHGNHLFRIDFAGHANHVPRSILLVMETIMFPRMIFRVLTRALQVLEIDFAGLWSILHFPRLILLVPVINISGRWNIILAIDFIVSENHIPKIEFAGRANHVPTIDFMGHENHVPRSILWVVRTMYPQSILWVMTDFNPATYFRITIPSIPAAMNGVMTDFIALTPLFEPSTCFSVVAGPRA